jgi:glycosyltransferase involved in cell wall biosynthesis
MKRLIREVAFVCLPTYREGMPKVLLKAAVAGRAVVATYVISCREAVVPGVTVDLIQARESCSLAKALLSSIMHTWRQKAYGAEGQVRATAVFSVTSVVSQTLNIYDGVLRHD